MTNTILLADDDQDFLRIEAKFLMHAGYSIIFARDAYQALHSAITQTPNLMILDVHMPAGEGFSVQERILSTPALRETPVIYLTGERSDEVKAAAKVLGAHAVIYKPFDFDELLNEIKKALDAQPPRTTQAGATFEFTLPGSM